VMRPTRSLRTWVRPNAQPLALKHPPRMGNAVTP
jgi:hypothetical protein